MIQLLLFGTASPFPTYADERELQAAAGTPTGRPDHWDSYYGLYRITSDHMIGIDRFTPDAGENWILMSDYQSGTVRRLFPVSETEFEMGPGFNVPAPPELRLRFATDANGNVAGVSLTPPDDAVAFAEKVPVQKQQVTFAEGTVTLAGTLLVPARKGPHPAIILLHGSGPLTRSSFGPYPHFFTSLGLAVLIYDKRGTGDSSGTRVDASHPVALAQSPTWFYLGGLADDARAALRYLRSRNDIDPRQIGLWGSSEGGMLATYVASQNKNIAFAINSSGFTGPLWQTVYYQAGAKQRESGVPQSQVDEALGVLVERRVHVARTDALALGASALVQPAACPKRGQLPGSRVVGTAGHLHGGPHCREKHAGGAARGRKQGRDTQNISERQPCTAGNALGEPDGSRCVCNPSLMAREAHTDLTA